MSSSSSNHQSRFRALLYTTLLSVIAATTVDAGPSKNLLRDGSGFETGPDGWDVNAFRYIQDPTDPSTAYEDAWAIVSEPDVEIIEGESALALHGSPEIQRHEVRWPARALLPNTDYTFSFYAMVELPGVVNCIPAGFNAELQVHNGHAAALSDSELRVRDNRMETCWKRLQFYFNTGDITEAQEHPDGKYGIILVFDTTALDVTETSSYRVLVDAPQLEESIGATAFQRGDDIDIGLDVVPVDVGAPVAERALRTYKLFEQDEPLNFRYWVSAEEGASRPRAIGYRVTDAYLTDNDRPIVYVEGQRIPDPGEGNIGTFTIPPGTFDGGSGTYRILLGAPEEKAREALVFGVLRPFDPAAEVSHEENQFGLQVGNYNYWHRRLNSDGIPGNDRPECEDVPPGEPMCTSDILYAQGPDPNLTFWLLDRLGFNYMRVFGVYHPNGYAPHDGVDGIWNMEQVQWFTETAHAYDLQIVAILGEKIHEAERYAGASVIGYPEWMVPDISGWDAFEAGYLRAYEELDNAIGGMIAAWEVYNEPTSSRHSIPIDNLIRLNGLAKSYFGEHDPGASVLGFGLTGIGPSGVRWSPDFPQGRNALFREFIEAGGLNSMDAGAMHLGVKSEVVTVDDSLYTHSLALRLTYCGQALLTEIQRLVDAYDPDNTGFPFWTTETTYKTGSVYPEFNVPDLKTLVLGRRIDQHKEAAQLLVHNFLAMLAGGWEKAIYFNLQATTNQGIHAPVFSTLTDVYNSPKTGMAAVYQTAQRLRGSEFVVQHNPRGVHRVYLEFRRANRTIVAVYSIDATRSAKPYRHTDPGKMLDMWGNRLDRTDIGPDPTFFDVPLQTNVASFVDRMEKKLAALEANEPETLAGADAARDLGSVRLPSAADPRAWDWECPAHIWNPWSPDRENLQGKIVDYRYRFEDSPSDRGFVIDGEITQCYSDDLGPDGSSIHSGDTVFMGSELLGPTAIVTEQLVPITGHIQQYMTIYERESGNTGVYLIGYTDPNFWNDPRYKISRIEFSRADPPNRRYDAEVHEVDLSEVLLENGYTVDPSKHYLVDLVTYAVGNNARFAIDNVSFSPATE